MYRRYFDKLATMKGYEIFGVFIAYAITILSLCWSIVSMIYDFTMPSGVLAQFEMAVRLSAICYGCGVLLIVASSIFGLIASVRESSREALRGFVYAVCLSTMLVVAYWFAFYDFL